MQLEGVRGSRNVNKEEDVLLKQRRSCPDDKMHVFFLRYRLPASAEGECAACISKSDSHFLGPTIVDCVIANADYGQSASNGGTAEMKKMSQHFLGC